MAAFEFGRLANTQTNGGRKRTHRGTHFSESIVIIPGLAGESLPKDGEDGEVASASVLRQQEPRQARRNAGKKGCKQRLFIYLFFLGVLYSGQPNGDLHDTL